MQFIIILGRLMLMAKISIVKTTTKRRRRSRPANPRPKRGRRR